jgi:Cof subfamily protein (haloacid dehalogenase superfamily)
MKRLPLECTLLVCDMDGTLLDSKCKISDKNLKAINRFVDKGGTFTLATGRMETSTRHYLDILPINAPVILYNGALIYDFKEEKVLDCNFLEYGTESIIKEIMNEFPELGIEIFHGGDAYFIRESEETELHKIKENLHPLLVDVENIPKPWYKVILAWKPDKLVKVEEFLKTRAGHFDMVYSEPQFIELINKGVSKGNALSRLVYILSLPLEKVVAVGDNMNDMEMIKIAGAGFAVENAHNKLKTCARYHCCHHNDHAISEVISWIEKNRIA